MADVKSEIDALEFPNLSRYFMQWWNNRNLELFIGCELDSRFRVFGISQIRLFLFAGHDPMSSTICYVVHLISTNASALHKIRAEHEAVLGADKSLLAGLIRRLESHTSHYHTTLTSKSECSKAVWCIPSPKIVQ
jgi:sterigmatocystin biosynthesis cytochrome P450 monooxygenase